MKCVICKHGATQAGKCVVTLVHNGTTLVFKHVPAQICQNCGEEYVAQDISERLLATASDASRSGVQVDVREFLAA